MIVAVSTGRDPFRHLALEAALLRHAAAGERYALLFYINDPCLVIGKHQNPWLECDAAAAAAEGVPLLRRFSGGGAVAHDPGNLNFALLMPRDRYRFEAQAETLLAALRGLGIPAERHQKTGLAVDGCKFSGQAFALRGREALHHGTLLVHSDLDRLRRLLAPPAGAAATTHATRSIRSPVMNLAERFPGVDMAALREAIVRAFAAAWAADAIERWDDARLAEVESADDEAKFRSWDWRYGQTPDFTWRHPAPPGAWIATVEQGMVRACAPDPEHPPCLSLPPWVIGGPFTLPAPSA
jgi:lipoate---protein ligase